MSGFSVDLERLAELVGGMSRCGQRLVEVEDDVDVRMKRIHATWQGAAATQHAEAHQRWVAGAQQMHEALVTLRSIASTADGNYTSAVRANTGMWRM